MDSRISSLQNLGSTLASARKTASLTQAEIAERADLRQATVSKVENGDQGVRLGTALSLIEANDLELILRPKTSC